MITQREGLLQAILAEPERDDLRLVFADLMEEEGRSPVASFIRCQIDNGVPKSVPQSWIGDVARGMFVGGFRNHGSRGHATLSTTLTTTKKDTELVWRRGFLDEVRCGLADWMEHGPAIVRQQPVTKVVATDKKPDHEEDNLWRWYAGYDAPDAIPKELAKHMMPAVRQYGAFSMGNEAAFYSKEEAVSALSESCLFWAKSQPV